MMVSWPLDVPVLSPTPLGYSAHARPALPQAAGAGLVAAGSMPLLVVLVVAALEVVDGSAVEAVGIDTSPLLVEVVTRSDEIVE